VAEAARAGVLLWCSWCNAHGGANGRLCTPGGIHYARIADARIAGKLTDTHLAAVMARMETMMPRPEHMVRLLPAEALRSPPRA